MNGPATQQIAQNALGDSILCDRLKTGRRSNRLTKCNSSVDRGHVGGQHHGTLTSRMRQRTEVPLIPFKAILPS